MNTSTLRSVVECQLQLGFPDITTRYFGDVEFTLFSKKSYTARLGLEVFWWFPVEIWLWTRKKLWNIQKDSKTTRWESINSAFCVSQCFTLLDTHWSDMAESYWIPKMHLSIIKMINFDCDYWTLFLTHSHIFKCFGKTQDCTSASKHPGQPQESLQPVIPFKMLAPWPEEDLLPVSSPKPHNCWNSLHFLLEKKRRNTSASITQTAAFIVLHSEPDITTHELGTPQPSKQLPLLIRNCNELQNLSCKPMGTQHFFILPRFWRNCT